MKAAVLVRHGDAARAFEIREVAKPVPAPGDVLIRSEASGINFADILARQGLYREAPAPPCILGYDLSGTVEAVGEGVDHSWIGKRVAAMTRFGAYAEWCTTRVAGCVEVPPEMSATAACALGTQYATAYYCAFVVQHVRPGERVLVHSAAGGVGSALVQLLRWRGCRVYATAGSDEKVNELQSIGVHAVNYRSSSYTEELKRLLGAERLDVSFNAVGGRSFRDDMRLLGSGGRLVLYGGADRSGRWGGKFATYAFLWRMGLVIPMLLMATSKSILGVNMLKIADYRPDLIRHCLDELIPLWSAGHIRPVEGGSFPASRIAEAHQFVESRQSKGKVIITW